MNLTQAQKEKLNAELDRWVGKSPRGIHQGRIRSLPDSQRIRGTGRR